MSTILIQTQKAFAAWRSQGHRQYHVELKRQAVSCLAYGSYKQVGDALSITGKTIWNWEKALNKLDQTKQHDQKPEFIPISLSHATSTTQCLSAQITLPSGLIISVPYQDIKEMMTFIVQLNKELSSCSI